MSVSVIAIDPAPRKRSTVCDGRTFCGKTAAQLRRMVCDLSTAGSSTLICWDAPLTGPSDPSRAGEPRDFSQRCIESFFSRREFKTPTGISVLPYSGCSHWAITRSLLGLPLTGPWDKGYHELPFRLLPCREEKEDTRPPVVEIHPAVAAWLWCRGQDGFPRDEEPWPYKDTKKADLRKAMWDSISRQAGDVVCRSPMNGDDDDFDAAVGYLLGVLYLKDRDKPESSQRVTLLGDGTTGSFLVPRVDGLLERWTEFVKEWPKLRNR